MSRDTTEESEIEAHGFQLTATANCYKCVFNNTRTIAVAITRSVEQLSFLRTYLK